MRSPITHPINHFLIVCQVIEHSVTSILCTGSAEVCSRPLQTLSIFTVEAAADTFFFKEQNWHLQFIRVMPLRVYRKHKKLYFVAIDIEKKDFQYFPNLELFLHST